MSFSSYVLPHRHTHQRASHSRAANPAAQLPTQALSKDQKFAVKAPSDSLSFQGRDGSISWLVSLDYQLHVDVQAPERWSVSLPCVP